MEDESAEQEGQLRAASGRVQNLLAFTIHEAIIFRQGLHVLAR